MPTPRPNIRRIDLVDEPATRNVTQDMDSMHVPLRWADRLAYAIIAVCLMVLAWMVWA